MTPQQKAPFNVGGGTPGTDPRGYASYNPSPAQLAPAPQGGNYYDYPPASTPSQQLAGPVGGPTPQNPPYPEYAGRDMGWTSSMGGAGPEPAPPMQAPQQTPYQQQYPEWHPNAPSSPQPPAQLPAGGGMGAAASSMPTPAAGHERLQDSPEYKEAPPPPHHHAHAHTPLPMLMHVL